MSLKNKKIKAQHITSGPIEYNYIADKEPTFNKIDNSKTISFVNKK